MVTVICVCLIIILVLIAIGIIGNIKFSKTLDEGPEYIKIQDSESANDFTNKSINVNDYMKPVKKMVDINAHIENLSWQTMVENGRMVVNISFDNLRNSNITAIKFTAKGYNALDDLVSIGDNDTFFIIIQDINICGNSRAWNIKAFLPDNNIRKLELEESQISYSDGSVLTYAGRNLKEFELKQSLEPSIFSDIINSLRERFGFEYIYKPLVCQEGWFCGCGRYNDINNNYCTRCGAKKTDVTKYTSDEEIEHYISNYLDLLNQKNVDNCKMAIIKERKKKRLIFNLFIGIAIIFVIFCLHSVCDYNRSIYGNVFEKYDLTDTRSEIRKEFGKPDKTQYGVYEDSGNYEDIIDEYNHKFLGNNGVIRVYYNEDEQVKKVVWRSTDIYEYDEIINFGKNVLDFYNEKYGDYKYDDYKKVIIWEETNTGYRYSLYINGTETGGNDKNWLEITYE